MHGAVAWRIWSRPRRGRSGSTTPGTTEQPREVGQRRNRGKEEAADETPREAADGTKRNVVRNKMTAPGGG